MLQTQSSTSSGCYDNVGDFAMIQRHLLDSEKLCNHLNQNIFVCKICGQQQLNGRLVQSLCYILDNKKQELNTSGMDKEIVVCSDSCRKKAVLHWNAYTPFMEDTNLPERYFYSTFNGILKKINNLNEKKERFELFKTLLGYLEKDGNFNKEGLFFSGPPGTGKTTTAAALMYEIRKREKTVWFVNFNRLSNYLNNLQNHQDFVNLIDNYMKFDYLVIDDLDSVFVADRAKEMFFGLFSEFYDRCKSVIITSNFSIDALPLEPKIISRIQRLCTEIAIEGIDFRAAN